MLIASSRKTGEFLSSTITVASAGTTTVDASAKPTPAALLDAPAVATPLCMSIEISALLVPSTFAT